LIQSKTVSENTNYNQIQEQQKWKVKPEPALSYPASTNVKNTQKTLRPSPKEKYFYPVVALAVTARPGFSSEKPIKQNCCPLLIGQCVGNSGRMSHLA
jgi:hypothetical protein